MTTIPVVDIGGFEWGPNRLVIPEHAFGIELKSTEVILSDEHKLYQWCQYNKAIDLLKSDSNRSALWELNPRLSNSKQ